MSTQTVPPTPGRLFPVCCAASIPPETINRFIVVNQNHYGTDESFFVFVDDTTRRYEVETNLGDRPESTSAESPFVGKTLLECYLLLRELSVNGSDM